jgi:hypothetical protein
MKRFRLKPHYLKSLKKADWIRLCGLLMFLAFAMFLSGCCWFRHDSGLWLKHALGKDYADPAVTTPKILAACDRLEKLTESKEPIAEANFFVWAPHGNLGFGEHAALAFQFGTCPNRELFVVDIGRRPKGSQTTEISVLRIYDFPTFLEYTGQDPHFEYSISWLCPNSTGKALVRNVLKDLAKYRAGGEAEPWNFNILVNNCARYVQDRLREVVSPPELRERVVKYREGEFINPSEFGEHLQVCNYFAQRLANAGQNPCMQDRVLVSRYFAKLPPEEKRAWLAFMAKFTELQADTVGFQQQLQ